MLQVWVRRFASKNRFDRVVSMKDKKAPSQKNNNSLVESNQDVANYSESSQQSSNNFQQAPTLKNYFMWGFGMTLGFIVIGVGLRMIGLEPAHPNSPQIEFIAKDQNQEM